MMQTIDPVMGPLESPEALQNEIDARNATLVTLREDFADVEAELERLQGSGTDMDTDSVHITEHMDTLTAEQETRSLDIADLEQQIRDADARIATLETSDSSFRVNWLDSAAPFGTVPGTNGKESFAVTVSPDGAFIARGDRAGNVELIDTVTGQQLFISKQSGNVCDLSFDETGRRLASVHTSGTVMIMDTQTHAVTTRSVPNTVMYGNMQWVGDEIFVATQDVTIHVVHALTGARRDIQAGGMVNGIARVGSDTLFAAGPVGPVSLFNKQGALLAQAPSPGYILMSAASPDGSMIAAVSLFGSVTVYDRSLQVIGYATGTGNGCRLAFLGNKGLTVYDTRGRLLVFNLSEMQNGQLGAPQILSTNGHQGFSNTMGVSPDGSMVFNVDPDNGIRGTRMPSNVITSTAAADIADEQATRATLVQSLDTLHTNMTAAQNQLNALQEEKNTLEELSAANDNDCADAERRLSALQTEIDGVLNDIDTLQARLDALDSVFVEMNPDNDSLAAGLAASVQSALDEEANRIGYAKMFVTYEKVGQSTVFTVRYRNPGERTMLDIKIDKSDSSSDYRGAIVAEDPISDGTWTFSLQSATNGGGQGLTFRMRNPDTQEILTELRGSYDADYNNASIETVQTPFETEEAGMLAENPITPSLSVGSISGPTLLLVVETPFDQFYIDTDMAGMLSTADSSSEGGTTFGLAQITVDTGRSTGYHTIRLYDRKGGQVIDTLSIYFDQGSRTITPGNPADEYSGSVSIADTDLAQQQLAMQALQTVPLGAGYAEIAQHQQLSLYEYTENLAAPHNLYFSADRMLDLLFTTPQYVKYADANMEQTVKDTWDSMGTYMKDGVLFHHYDFSHAQTNVMLSKKQITEEFMGKLAVYGQGVSACMQSAVNIFLGILQGQPEEPLRQAYDAVYSQWASNGIIQSLAGIGMSLPNSWTLRMAAKEVFYGHWQYLVDTAEDVVQVRAREEYLRRVKETEDAKNAFKNAGGDADALPVTMSRRQITLATKIRQTLDLMTDSRIVSMNPLRKNAVAIEVAQNLGDVSTLQALHINDALTKVMDMDLQDLYVADSLSNSVGGTVVTSPDFNQSTDNNVPYALTMGADALFQKNIHLTENSILNLILTHDDIAFNDRNVTLSVYNVDTHKMEWTSAKKGISANTISASFPAGNYRVMVSTAQALSPSVSTPPNSRLHLTIDVKKESGTKREGMISLEGNRKAMPVSLSLVAFNNQGAPTNIDPATGRELVFDPNKAVWVVAHGRRDDPNSDQMEEVARNLFNQDQQVLVVDWQEAAKDFIRLPSLIPGMEDIDTLDLRDASWTPAVGKWVAQQLMGLGLKPELVNGDTHSHGTYVGYFMGEEIMRITGEKMNTLVALDPAKNPWFANNTITESDIHFDAVSKNSWSMISSVLGSTTIADTATRYLEVASSNRNSVINATEAHGYAVTLFSNIILRNTVIDTRLSLSSVLSAGNLPGLSRHLGEEGTITIDIDHEYHKNGSDWFKAQYQQLFDTINWQEGSSSGSNS